MERFKNIMKIRLKLFRNCTTIKNEDDEGESCIQATVEVGSSTHASLLLDLPICILVEIFLRLPIKSILCCRSVCKTFSTILKDSCFLNAYEMKPILAMFPTDSGKPFGSLYLLELDNDTGEFKSSEKPALANIPPNKGHLYVLGSCNGLVCIAESFKGDRMARFIYICNPILGEYSKLPVVGKRHVPVSYGFGFDSSSDHYKVVRFLAETNPIDIYHEVKTYVEVFTVGVDVKWRALKHETGPRIIGPKGRIESLEVNRLFGSQGLLFQDAIHWTLDQGSYIFHPSSFSFICAFNIGQEKFRQIRVPTEMRLNGGVFSLLILRNCLCILSIIDTQELQQLNIWTMKEYGVVESWSKEYSVSFLSFGFHRFLPTPYIKWGDGEITMFLCEFRLVRFNLDEMKFTYTVIHDTKIFYSTDAYLPSLVSLKNVLSGKGVKVRMVKNKKRWFQPN